ncbi:MAG: beta-propeller domain-containing protein [Tepidanaerobacteraceae bacterium]|jgi:uncharacterized secreted protein with C-terminal beta-propeller domain|nr:beta-propeller domain-containing protein [Tepidanaerobacteraceae bacterium]
MISKKSGLYVLLVVLLILGLAQLSKPNGMALSSAGAEQGVNLDSGKTISLDSLDAEGSLPVLGSYEKLKELMSRIQTRYPRCDVKFLSMNSIAKSTASADGTQEMAPRSGSGDENGASADFSVTNVQVKGVDEADIVKTDGKYIYQVNNRRVAIIDAYPADTMKITGFINFDDADFSPQELYLDDMHLVVIGSSVRPIPLVEQNKASVNTGGISSGNFAGADRQSLIPEIYPARYSYGTVKAIIYDMRDKKNIRKIRELELEGFYISSRKIGASLYLVANRNMDFRILENLTQDQNLTPSYRDTVSGDEFSNIGYDKIRYFSQCPEPNYLIIAGLNLDKPKEKADISTYLGAGENIYASAENLYVALTGYEDAEAEVKHDANYEEGSVSNESFSIKPLEYDTCTLIYKFGLNGGKVAFKAKGKVPGIILNQFSMDEYKGNFRIATTTGKVWRTDEQTSKNNMYVLDGGMNIAGSLEGIAPGEKIYSVRFMGDRGYMVTFKKVDPLFVVDLKDPAKPQILGALKIPGYSDYIHPYDENHIIGFGKDTIEVEQKDAEGIPIRSMAFYQGMKIALFDVSDVNHPVEKFKEIIGNRGTDSELLRNHKALLFSKEKNLMAFPVTVMETKDKDDAVKGNMPQYGEFSFQGAYVYDIDLQKGFKLKGRITHLSPEDYIKAGNGWYDSRRNVERIIYIGENLYTLSGGMVKASRMSDLKEISALDIPQ